MSDSAKRKEGASAAIRATRPFAIEDSRRTWWEFLSTIVAYFACQAFVGLIRPWPLKIAGVLVLALLGLRLFSFYHDLQHAAIFRRSPVGRFLVTLWGLYTATLPSLWREQHNSHHQQIGQMGLAGSPYSYLPTVDVDGWRRLDKKERRRYRVYRHWMRIFLAYPLRYLYAAGSFISNPRAHLDAPVGLALYAAGSYGWYRLFGWEGLVFNVVLPSFMGTMFGVYIVRAMHTGAEIPGWRYPGPQWDYTHSAIMGSTMMDMSRGMHWLMGNLGYHHVHHLNHRIPFYRLPEAMAAIPELQNPPRTSWRLKDILTCLRVNVVDTATGRMLSYREADAMEADAMTEGRANSSVVTSAPPAAAS